VSGARIGTREKWLAQRLELLAQEKELNRRRDELAAARRRLPWVPVERDYRFEGADGTRTLAELFDGCSQLAVYHFMFGPDWEEGCPSCSFWADNYDGVTTHLAHRDVRLVAVSRAPYATLAAYRDRMGWSFPWYSSDDNGFNVGFHVSFTAEQQERGAEYNYAPSPNPPEEAPGLSVFASDGSGAVFHTYSTYARGLDPFNTAYQLLDLVPKGRDEDGLPWSMAWLRRHDAYDDQPADARG
jgi:predicted dithiol-disulfide oxidoreductase (DUF899 family)